MLIRRPHAQPKPPLFNILLCNRFLTSSQGLQLLFAPGEFDDGLKAMMRE